MSPTLTGRGRLAAWVVAWLQTAGLLALLLGYSGTLRRAEVLAVALPLGAVYASVCVALYYLAREVPLRHGPVRLATTHAAAVAITASVLVLAGRGWVELLSELRVPAAAPLFPSPGPVYAGAVAPVVFVVGLLVLALALALHYLLIAADESRRAETRAVEAQLRSREAELKALRAQLHPHFLFNSLNSINALIRSDPDAARSTCLQLGTLLRRSLSVSSRERIPLGEELELAETLLSIEKVRFGERLTYALSVEEDARACLLPPLLLQPLVENAVTHGIAGLLDGGEIRIEARRVGERLRLVVENPRDPETPARSGTGVGLDNVWRRLVALYGRGAELRLWDEPERFRVELDVPLPPEGED